MSVEAFEDAVRWSMRRAQDEIEADRRLRHIIDRCFPCEYSFDCEYDPEGCDQPTASEIAEIHALAVHCRYCQSWRPAKRSRAGPGAPFLMLHMKCGCNGEILPELAPARMCHEFYTNDPRSKFYERFKASGWRPSLNELLKAEAETTTRSCDGH